MECPKCHENIADDAVTCPYCHKVLALVCPNCRTLGYSPVCDKCGYIILEKCSKCGRLVPSTAMKCKCGFPVSTSIAYQECESDEFASMVVKFGSLKNIRRILASKDLYDKFCMKLKNLLTSQLKNTDGKIILYEDTYVINFNKELSFQTSVNKAVRLSIKLVNMFTRLNLKVQEEFGVPLNLKTTIVKKNAEELLLLPSYESNIKLLNTGRNEKKYLKGLQIIIDQYVQDCISNEYTTDSLYTIEGNSGSVMFYEILLDKYVLPPDKDKEDESVQVIAKEIKKSKSQKEDDLYSFRVFDINAKCDFQKSNASELCNYLGSKKILSIRTDENYAPKISTLVKYYKNTDKKVLYVTCSEDVNYKPWGVFENLYKSYLAISENPLNFESLMNLAAGIPRKASTPEDARFAYMEDCGRFLSSLSGYVVIIDGFEYMDDTSIQTLELYFDKYKKIKPEFVFITDSELAVHSKIKSLLETSEYSEISLKYIEIDELISELKDDASDFINSFYYEKITENYCGSKLYFDNAIRFLKEKDILISFENKLIIKNNDSVVLPSALTDLLKLRLKNLAANPDASLILAYSAYLGSKVDFKELEMLGVNEVRKNSELLESLEYLYIEGDSIFINNYNLIRPVIMSSLKKEIEEFLCKNILAKFGKNLNNTLMLLLMGKLEMYKEEYLLLWKNSQFAINVGDYDSYLKNCLGCLALMEHIGENIPAADIEDNKKEIYHNILSSLYSYSPEKIYSIENILLMDALRENDNEKIVKLSNLMLQGALISSNYSGASTLLHNILIRMKNPKLLVDGAINTRFLLLSLVNVEIMFNVGDFKNCIDLTNDILDVIHPDIIEKIKPASFSLNSFTSHMLDTCRLAAMAMIITADKNLMNFFEKVQASIGAELPDKNCLLSVKDYLSGKSFAISENIEDASSFSKVIYLILQEFSQHKTDFKNFAQNIYQAKLLSADIHQKQLQVLCELLIAHSYASLGITKKAEAMYNDILEKSEKSAIFNLVMLGKYFTAKLKLLNKQSDEAIQIINDSLATLQNYENQAALFYVMFERLFIDVVKEYKISAVDVKSERQKLKKVAAEAELTRLLDK